MNRLIEARELAEIWDQHAERVLLITRAMGEPAEDAVQDAFVALACQSERPRDPLAWLIQVARNQLLQAYRAGVRRQKRESLVGAKNWFAGDHIHVDRKLDASEVTAALLRMPSPEREIIVMHLWGEMTFETIAEIVELSRAATHRAFHHGIDLLKTEFARKKDESEVTDLPVSKFCHE